MNIIKDTIAINKIVNKRLIDISIGKQKPKNISEKMDEKRLIAKRHRSILNQIYNVNLWNFILKDGIIEFWYENDEFEFRLPLSAVSKGGHYEIGNRFDWDTKDAFISDVDYYKEMTNADKLAAIRHYIKSKPEVLKAYEYDTENEIHYQYIMK